MISNMGKFNHLYLWTLLIAVGTQSPTVALSNLNLQCEYEYQEDIPYKVISLPHYEDQRRKRHWTRARIQNSKTQRYHSKAAPRLSLVKETGKEQKNSLYVKFLTLPNSETYTNMKSNWRFHSSLPILPWVSEEEKGYVYKKVLKPVKDFIFYNKLNKKFYEFNEGDRGFLTYNCYNKKEQSFESKFSFKVYNRQSLDEVPELSFAYLSKDFFNNLTVLPKNNIQAYVRLTEVLELESFDLSEFEIKDAKGFVKIPFDYSKYTMDSKKRRFIPGPLKTIHYHPDDKHAGDAYAHPVSMCAFFKAIKEYNNYCDSKACRVQFGDFYHSRAWKVHRIHGSGSCVDIRPIRKTVGLNPVNYVTRIGRGKWFSHPDYDPQKTQTLVDELVAAGGVGSFSEKTGRIKNRNILFNDTQNIKGVDRARGHSDHMHVCFPPETKAVQEACFS